MSDKTLCTFSLKCCSSWLNNLKAHLINLQWQVSIPQEFIALSSDWEQHEQDDRHQYSTLELTSTATIQQSHETKKPKPFYLVYKNNYHQPFHLVHVHSYQPTKKNTSPPHLAFLHNNASTSQHFDTLQLLGVTTSTSSISRCRAFASYVGSRGQGPRTRRLPRRARWLGLGVPVILLVHGAWLQLPKILTSYMVSELGSKQQPESVVQGRGTTRSSFPGRGTRSSVPGRGTQSSVPGRGTRLSLGTWIKVYLVCSSGPCMTISLSKLNLLLFLQKSKKPKVLMTI